VGNRNRHSPEANIATPYWQWPKNLTEWPRHAAFRVEFSAAQMRRENREMQDATTTWDLVGRAD
jgi:hypothetical protein